MNFFTLYTIDFLASSTNTFDFANVVNFFFTCYKHIHIIVVFMSLSGFNSFLGGLGLLTFSPFIHAKYLHFAVVIKNASICQ